MELTATQLTLIMPRLTAAQRDLYLPLLNRAINDFHVNSWTRLAAFLAQIITENGTFYCWPGIQSLRYLRRLGDAGLEPQYSLQTMGSFWADNYMNERADMLTGVWCYHEEKLFHAICQNVPGSIELWSRRVVYYRRALQVLSPEYPPPTEQLTEEQPAEKPQSNLPPVVVQLSDTAQIDRSILAATPPPGLREQLARTRGGRLSGHLLRFILVTLWMFHALRQGGIMSIIFLVCIFLLIFQAYRVDLKLVYYRWLTNLKVSREIHA